MIALTPHQESALALLMAFAAGRTEHTMAALEGYAGTGKTTLVGELVGALAGEIGIAVAAPTNKAVAVLVDKIDSDVISTAATIHSLLGLKLEELENGEAKCTPDGEPTLDNFELVIVDEASMISTDLFNQILLHRGRARILFVGDSMQLPPVGESATSPAFRLVDHRIRLAEVVRQAAENPIIALSMRIRKWIEADHRPSADDIAAAIPPTPGLLKPASVQVGDESIVRRFAEQTHHAGLSFRIVGFTNKAAIGHNLALHYALHGATEFPFVIGETVIAQEAFAARVVGFPIGSGVANSAELAVEQIERGRHERFADVDAMRMLLRSADGNLVECFAPVDQAQFDADMVVRWKLWRDTKARALAAAPAAREGLLSMARAISKINWARRRAFASLRHAYAVTTHKSQGSTFDVVILDLHDLAKMRSTFDFNRALYVAVTRAAKFISIVSPYSPVAQLEADLAAATDPSDAALLRQLIAEIRVGAVPPPAPRVTP